MWSKTMSCSNTDDFILENKGEGKVLKRKAMGWSNINDFIPEKSEYELVYT